MVNYVNRDKREFWLYNCTASEILGVSLRQNKG